MQRMKNKGRFCLQDGCENEAVRRGECGKHYQRTRARLGSNSRRCSFEGCDRAHVRYGWCDAHSIQARKGREMKPIRKVRAHQTVTADGYIKVWSPDHPNAQSRGWILEHVKVMSAAIGRPLIAGENVHHRNGVKGDNRLENLELWSTSQPKGQRVEDKVQYALEILSQYRPELIA